MQRIKGQVPEQQELAIQSLAWVSFAKRPLTELELRHALAIEEGESDLDEDNIPEVEDVLSVCAGLLASESGIVRLVHYTAQEYFERTHTRWFLGFSENHISNLCVTYLLFESFGVGPCETNEAFDDRLRDYPLYGYAAHHWGSHMREAQKFDTKVIEFLENEAKVEASVQALNVTRGHSIQNWSQKYTKGMKGLHLAAFLGVHQLVSLLLRRLHFVDMRDDDGYTPLIQASMAGHPAVIKLLLANGAYFDATANNNTTPLYWTAFNGDEETVQLLLELGADVSFRNRTETALMAASGEGHLGVVDLLLARGADVNRPDEIFGTSLERASAEGHLQMVKLLLEKGADISEGAFESASERDQEDVIKFILGKTTGIQGQSINYGKALHVASTRGNHSIVRLLLDNNANINTQCEHDGTPLIVASAAGNRATVQLLLDNNADINAQSGRYGTPLIAASARGHITVLQILLSHGADVDGRGPLHGTALQAASAKGHQQIVEILLRHGADPYIRGGIHKMALRAAKLCGHGDIVDMLEKHQHQLHY
jgi:ankyrin repeat protein